ncbi:MAG TPA: hypothetical protein VFH97_09345, partial [Gemmatimonadales bacterium]|nr:hypothetical protein [Gemmatimonadales bacterium]
MKIPSLLALAVAFASVPAAAVAQGGLTADPRIVQLLDAVSEQRLQGIVEKLASFRTRNTLSSVTDPRAGVGAARQWIHDELKGYSPRLLVSFDRHVVPQGGRITREVELVNVMAVLPGRSPRRVYVS